MTARFEFYERAPMGVTWRLLSSNNRDLGRSASGYSDVDDCISAVETLRAALADTEPQVYRVNRLAWAWRLDVADTAAVASRAYQRRVQAQTACGLFVKLASVAEITPAVRQART
ncbi:hypothetical protein Cs7R123_29230 [Catellatospora sp. TT07R-123]|uniref:hypothetical protein n=1 Tax=Catellatospora sp. TT07R-123 TaxID=2733863 RepID=UPI001B221A86|nr:hypothetical protein [Catellatospora sp. TT07R-123]GHJ45581.1 hypothetical protein Cs7R123_29230 [Catellatospora sp. TT07R-123]